MTIKSAPRSGAMIFTRPITRNLLAASVAALALAACRPGEEHSQVAGWVLVDPSQRHPIMVSQQPAKLAMRVARGSQGLSPHQRAQLYDFLEKYRSGDAGNSKLVIAAPSGSPNEVASMQAVAEIRYVMREAGFDESAITVEAYYADDPQPPVKISYLRYVAEGPECGRWTTNLATDHRNLPYPNFGCANQRNFAAQVANPADLLGPRTMTERDSRMRDKTYEKLLKGESTVSNRKQEERAQTKGE